MLSELLNGYCMSEESYHSKIIAVYEKSLLYQFMLFIFHKYNCESVIIGVKHFNKCFQICLCNRKVLLYAYVFL